MMRRRRDRAGMGAEHAMPGMSTYLQTKNPVVVSAFHTALLHQLLFIGLVLVVLSLVWNILRTAQYRVPPPEGPGRPDPVAAGGAEPVARRVLRIGFGLLWIRDGLLQLQSAMPLGLAHERPRTLGLLLSRLGPTCREHRRDHLDPPPGPGGGVGGLAPARDRRRLLLAPRGRWSRFAGLAGAGWGLVVWVFGEAFGGIFGQGSSWLFGTPGAALFYCVAGVLVALPESTWSGPGSVG